MSPLAPVSAAVRHVARYIADRASSGPPRDDVCPAAIQIITGSTPARPRNGGRA